MASVFVDIGGGIEYDGARQIPNALLSRGVNAMISPSKAPPIMLTKHVETGAKFIHVLQESSSCASVLRFLQKLGASPSQSILLAPNTANETYKWQALGGTTIVGNLIDAITAIIECDFYQTPAMNTILSFKGISVSEAREMVTYNLDMAEAPGFWITVLSRAEAESAYFGDIFGIDTAAARSSLGLEKYGCALGVEVNHD